MEKNCLNSSLFGQTHWIAFFLYIYYWFCCFFRLALGCIFVWTDFAPCQINCILNKFHIALSLLGSFTKALASFRPKTAVWSHQQTDSAAKAAKAQSDGWTPQNGYNTWNGQQKGLPRTTPSYKSVSTFSQDHIPPLNERGTSKCPLAKRNNIYTYIYIYYTNNQFVGSMFGFRVFSFLSFS